jgi:hypothetical protein
MAGNTFAFVTKRMIQSGDINKPIFRKNTRIFNTIAFNMTFGSMSRTSEFYSIPLLRYNYVHSLKQY